MSKTETKNFQGSDLNLAEFLLGADFQVSKNGDIEIISGDMNIAQATGNHVAYMVNIIKIDN